MAESTGPGEPRSGGELANVLWLLPLRRFERVVLLGSDAATDLSEVAQARFRSVLSRTALDAMEAGSADCVVAHSKAGVNLVDCRRVLHPEGWLVLASDPASARGDLRLLQSSGFRETRSYRAHPSAGRPYVLVPDAASALRQYGRLTAGTWSITARLSALLRPKRAAYEARVFLAAP